MANTPTVPDDTTRTPRFTRRRKLLLGGLALALFLPVLGAAFQAAAAAADARRFPPPGQLIDVGGYHLHMLVMGAEHTHAPTIILESAAMSASPQWVRIQSTLAAHYRVVVYDRPGMGWSGSGAEPFTATRAARALHTALERAGISGPYILVGHSLGGIFARIFAGQYPDDVAGIVLVDSSHPEQGERMGANNDIAAGARSMAILPWLVRFGGTRLIDMTGGMLEGAPAEQAGALRSFLANERHVTTMLAEMESFEALGQAAVEAGLPGERPLIVLSAGQLPDGMASADPEAYLATWHALHADLAALSSRGEQRIIPGSNHFTIVFDPHHSATVAAAIAEVAAAADTR